MTRRLKTAALLVSLLLIFCAGGCAQGNGTAANGTAVGKSVKVKEPNSHSLDDYKKTADDRSVPAAPDTASPDTSAAEKPQEETVSQVGGNAEYQGVYYANTNTKKFHLADCGSVKRMNQENIYTTASREELINSGYVPCALCNP